MWELIYHEGMEAETGAFNGNLVSEDKRKVLTYNVNLLRGRVSRNEHFCLLLCMEVEQVCSNKIPGTELVMETFSLIHLCKN